MKISVIVCTYNAPRELDLCFSGLFRQVRVPDEVLVADDGSSGETRELVASWRRRITCPVRHVWQSDQGYRKARIVNEAVRRAGGEHLVFLDGDTIPHSRWVLDHAIAASGRRVLCGRRVKLGPLISRKVRSDQILNGALESLTGPVLRSFLRRDTKRFLLGVRLPAWLARCFHPRARKLMGVNYSLPRKVFEEVNGYDEEWTVYGHEDRDLELRLLRSGWPFYPLLNRAVVYHLHHTARVRTAQTVALIASQEASNRSRCCKGLTGSEPFDPDS